MYLFLLILHLVACTIPEESHSIHPSVDGVVKQLFFNGLVTGGISVGISVRGDEFVKSYGWADQDQGIPLSSFTTSMRWGKTLSRELLNIVLLRRLIQEGWFEESIVREDVESVLKDYYIPSNFERCLFVPLGVINNHDLEVFKVPETELDVFKGILLRTCPLKELSIWKSYGMCWRDESIVVARLLKLDPSPNQLSNNVWGLPEECSKSRPGYDPLLVRLALPTDSRFISLESLLKQKSGMGESEYGPLKAVPNTETRFSSFGSKMVERMITEKCQSHFLDSSTTDLSLNFRAVLDSLLPRIKEESEMLRAKHLINAMVLYPLGLKLTTDRLATHYSNGKVKFDLPSTASTPKTFLDLCKGILFNTTFLNQDQRNEFFAPCEKMVEPRGPFDSAGTGWLCRSSSLMKFPSPFKSTWYGHSDEHSLMIIDPYHQICLVLMTNDNAVDLSSLALELEPVIIKEFIGK